MHDFKVIPSRMCRLVVRSEPQQHLIEIVGVRSSPPTLYIEQYRINNKSSTSGVLKLFHARSLIISTAVPCFSHRTEAIGEKFTPENQ